MRSSSLVEAAWKALLVSRKSDGEKFVMKEVDLKEFRTQRERVRLLK